MANAALLRKALEELFAPSHVCETRCGDYAAIRTSGYDVGGFMADGSLSQSDADADALMR